MSCDAGSHEPAEAGLGRLRRHLIPVTGCSWISGRASQPTEPPHGRRIAYCRAIENRGLYARGENGDAFKLSLTLPPGMSAQVQFLATSHASGVTIGGKPAGARHEGRWWILDSDVTGTSLIEMR